MDAPDNRPDWGRLIDDARDRMGISQNEAARRADITGTHWRKIVKGEVGAMASPRGLRTVARMAHVVALSPEQLAEVGRADVAAALQRLIAPERQRGDDFEERIAAIGADPRKRQRLLDLLRSGLIPEENEEPQRKRDAG